MFFTIPNITSSVSTQVYGTYAAILSFTVFLSYADFGFLSAANKYGCDQYLKKDKNKEIELIAAATFVQTIAFLVFALICFVFAWKPSIIMSGLDKDLNNISSKLFILLAVFAFTTIPRRVIYAIAQFRIEAYRISPWMSLVGVANILLVFMIFTSNNNMNIVYYYFFTNLLVFIVIMGLGIHFFRKWNYSIKYFLSNFRFNKKALKLLWPFASASLLGSFMYVLYYEMDTFYICKFISVNELAFYSIGVILSGVFRRISSTLISPYMPKFNEFYVHNDDIGMKNFYLSSVAVTTPFVLIPVIVSIMLMPQFIIAWVGEKFVSSILISQLLVGAWILAPLMDLPSFIINAKVKIRLMYISSILVTALFWAIVITFKDQYGIKAVAAGKFISSMASGIFLLYVSHLLIKLKLSEYFRKIILPIVIVALFTIIACIPFTGAAMVKNKTELLRITLVGGLISFISIIFYISISKQFRSSFGKDNLFFTKLRSLRNKITG
jgi:O-antigen/teichoic acid export membrane protein